MLIQLWLARPGHDGSWESSNHIQSMVVVLVSRRRWSRFRFILRHSCEVGFCSCLQGQLALSALCVSGSAVELTQPGRPCGVHCCDAGTRLVQWALCYRGWCSTKGPQVRTTVPYRCKYVEAGSPIVQPAWIRLVDRQLVD